MKPKILLFDIETSPLLCWTWGLFDQNIALNQIEKDWCVLSWSAKWADSSKIMYMDQRKAKDVYDDKKMLKEIWKLLDSADIVVTQNGKSFDSKKLNARFLMHGMQPPSSYKHFDTLQIVKKYFAMTSNKLEFLSDKLCNTKKSDHKKFPGFSLWKECLKGNLEAWKEMEKYNKKDVISLEELYNKLKTWDNAINLNLYSDEAANICSCGSKVFKRNGYSYTSSGKYQRFKCTNCGNEVRSKKNELSKEKRNSLLVGINR